MVNLEKQPDKVVTVNGFSKSHAMTGWRIGYACFPDSLKQRIIKIQQHINTNTCTFIQEGLAQVLPIDETYLTEWEAELAHMDEEHSEGEENTEGEEHVHAEADGHHHGEETKDHQTEKAEAMEKISNLREKIESSEKGYLSNFSVECVKYEILEEVEEEITEEPAAE